MTTKKDVKRAVEDDPTVNHPDHYQLGGIEVIDAIEAWGLDFHDGNVVKYLSRAGKKTDDPLPDYNKAFWYLQRKIALLMAKRGEKAK